MWWKAARPLIALVVSGTFLSCAGEAPRAPARDSAGAAAPAVTDSARLAAATDRARAAANALGKELQTRLFAALDSGGPERAIAICADSAQAWTARHAREGVYVRRVSLRVRNPANRPDSVEQTTLHRLESLFVAGTLPGEIVTARTLRGGERLVEYVRPILVQERCLACHGARERLTPAVVRLLRERYPEDRATGYRTGDLRGMLSVRALW